MLSSLELSTLLLRLLQLSQVITLSNDFASCNESITVVCDWVLLVEGDHFVQRLERAVVAYYKVPLFVVLVDHEVLASTFEVE